MRHLTSVALLVFLLTAPCAPAAELEVPRLFWPPPQATPRLEYLGIYASQHDLPRQQSTLAAWFAKLAGPVEVPRLQRPTGIAVDARGRVLVADAKHGNVWAFDAAAGQVAALFDPQRAGFEELGTLQVDGAGRIFVVDRGKRKVLVYAADLTPLFALAPTNKEATPAFVAVSGSGTRIYVSTPEPPEIAVYGGDGGYLFSFGGETLHEPRGMAFNAAGELLVADAGQGTLEIFDSGGTYLRRFGGREAENALERPIDLAFDSEGHLFVIDENRAALFTFAADGEVLLATGSSTPSRHPLGFARPTDLCITADDRIFIADRFNQRYSAWQYLSAPYLAQHPVTGDDLARMTAFVDQLRQQAGAEGAPMLAGDATSAGGSRPLQPCVLAQRPGEAAPPGRRVLCPVCQQCVDEATFDQHTHLPPSRNKQTASP